MDNGQLRAGQGVRLSNDQLWEKAATSEPITRSDVNMVNTNSYAGVEILNEGFNVLRYNDQSGNTYKGADESLTS